MQNRPDNNYYLVFNSQNNTLAAKVQSVVEVLEKQRITKIPKSPKQIMGVISFRGEIIPVIDPRVILDLPPHQFDDFVIIVHKVHNDRYNETLTVGVLARDVSNVIEVKPLDILPASEFNTVIPEKYTIGVFKNSGSFITILDTDKILAISDHTIHDDNQN